MIDQSTDINVIMGMVSYHAIADTYDRQQDAYAWIREAITALADKNDAMRRALSDAESATRSLLRAYDDDHISADKSGEQVLARLWGAWNFCDDELDRSEANDWEERRTRLIDAAREVNSMWLVSKTIVGTSDDARTALQELDDAMDGYDWRKFVLAPSASNPGEETSDQ